MDAEAKITGFNEEGIHVYMNKYLGSGDKCEELSEKAEVSAIIEKREYDGDIDGLTCGDYSSCTNASAIIRLGKLAMEGLQREEMQQLFDR